MADSTTWTLEFVDHDGNDIVLIPGATELAANYYFHLQDGGFDVGMPKKKTVWVGSGNTSRMGSSLVHENYGNREIRMSLNIVADDRNYVIDAFQELFKFSNEVGYYASEPEFRRGYWYIRKQWLGTTDTIYSYLLVLSCSVSAMPNLYGESGLNFYDGKYTVPVELSITAESAWRDVVPMAIGTQIITQSSSSLGAYLDDAYTDPYIEIPGSDIVGDLPPMLRLSVSGRDSGGTNHPRKFHFAVRSVGVGAQGGTLKSFFNRKTASRGVIAGGSAYSYISTATGPCGDVLYGITNGNFLSPGAGGVDIWGDWVETVSDGVLGSDTSYAHRFRKSAKITAGSSINTTIDQDVAVVASTDFSFNAFCYTPSGNNPLRYSIYDESNGAWIQTMTDMSDGGEMFYGTLNRFTTPALCIEVKITIYCPDTDGHYGYVDAVTLARHNAVEITPSGAADAERLYLDFSAGSVVNDGDFIGSYRVRARVKLRAGVSAVTDVGIRAEYQIGGHYSGEESNDVGDGSYRYVTAVDEWQLIDFGKFDHLPNPSIALSAAGVVIKLYTVHDTTGDYMDVDYVELVPIDEGCGWIETTQDVDSSYEAIIINQYIPGKQDVWFEPGSNAGIESNIIDYDITPINLLPGRDYRIYVNAELDELSDEDMHVWMSAWRVSQRLLVA